ncbi:MAG: 3-deoxy-D-manno-octulosonic acid kinase [Campylobacterales bacterium]
MTPLSIVENNAEILLFAPGEEARYEPQWFAPETVLGRAEGRGETLFFQAGNRQLVLRRYRRAGLAARFSKEHYLWTGLKNSRPYRELALTQQLFEAGLPVPKPVAARIIKNTFFYTADLITERITGAVALDKHPAPPWEEIGRTIARFHAYGLNHSDLNARNILIADGKVWVIDFDKCAIKPEKSNQHSPNLRRLRRSLIKLSIYNEANWDKMIEGYLDAGRIR